MRQRAGKAGYGQANRGFAICNGGNKARGQECERHQESDMTLGESLGGRGRVSLKFKRADDECQDAFPSRY